MFLLWRFLLTSPAPAIEAFFCICAVGILWLYIKYREEIDE